MGNIAAVSLGVADPPPTISRDGWGRRGRILGRRGAERVGDPFASERFRHVASRSAGGSARNRPPTIDRNTHDSGCIRPVSWSAAERHPSPCHEARHCRLSRFPVQSRHLGIRRHDGRHGTPRRHGACHKRLQQLGIAGQRCPVVRRAARVRASLDALPRLHGAPRSRSPPCAPCAPCACTHRPGCTRARTTGPGTVCTDEGGMGGVAHAHTVKALPWQRERCSRALA